MKRALNCEGLAPHEGRFPPGAPRWKEKQVLRLRLVETYWETVVPRSPTLRMTDFKREHAWNFNNALQRDNPKTLVLLKLLGSDLLR